LVQEYVYRYPFKTFPVVDGNRLVGCVNASAISEVPRAEWDRRAVSELVQQCSSEETIGQSVDAMQALTKMSRTRSNWLLVVEGEQLLGIITLKDLLQYLSLRMGLERGIPRA
jgi:CBS domain-containing protein